MKKFLILTLFLSVLCFAEEPSGEKPAVEYKEYFSKEYIVLNVGGCIMDSCAIEVKRTKIDGDSEYYWSYGPAVKGQKIYLYCGTTKENKTTCDPSLMYMWKSWKDNGRTFKGSDIDIR